MKTNYLTILAAVVIVGGASFVAGRMSGSRGQAENQDQPAATLPSKSPRDGRGTLSSAIQDRDRSDRTGTRSTTETELSARMRDALDQPDTVDRTRAWLDFLDQLSPGEFLDVIASFREGGVPEDRMGEYAMLLSAWARIDPIAALDYAKENTGSPFARQTILASWATSDPDAALRWAEANHEGEGANPWLVGVIRGIAAADPGRATDIMLSMPFSRERGAALSAVLPKILEQGPDAARDWVTGIDDEKLREGAMARIAERLASVDPKGTAEWLAANPGDAARRSMDNVLSAWVKEDQSAAVAYFQQLPTGETRSNALRGIVNSVAMNDPQQAANLLDRYPADANDRVVQQFVWHSFRGEPSLAADYISRIDDQKERDRTYDRMLDGWIQRDEPAAMAWMADNTLPESVVKNLERRLLERQQRRQ